MILVLSQLYSRETEASFKRTARILEGSMEPDLMRSFFGIGLTKKWRNASFIGRSNGNKVSEYYFLKDYFRELAILR